MLALLVSSFISLRASSQQAINQQISKKITHAIAESKLPSLSIAIGRAGKIIFSDAQGLADQENSVPASTQSIYRIGSITKTITATAVLQLAEAGKLNLDAQVQQFCPAFPVKQYPVTLRQLLAHLGGIRDYNYQRFEEEFLSAKRYASIADSLVVFSNDAL